jgi:SpoVK/Ycf46/Vps4 family AAA+-type ATPase
MILDIHTKGWQPPVPDPLKDELAELTKGYGGADLRALCTEAALNAVQRRYPQIYASNEKLHIQPETISIAAKDFMISIKKIIPSSERAGTSGAAPLPKSLEPLLRESLAEVKSLLAEILPQKKQYTALEEAQFEDAEGDKGMGKERMQQGM